MDDFDALLHSIRAVHSRALCQVECHNDALKAEVAELRSFLDASVKDSDRQGYDTLCHHTGRQNILYEEPSHAAVPVFNQEVTDISFASSLGGCSPPMSPAVPPRVSVRHQELPPLPARSSIRTSFGPKPVPRPSAAGLACLPPARSGSRLALAAPARASMAPMSNLHLTSSSQASGGFGSSLRVMASFRSSERLKAQSDRLLRAIHSAQQRMAGSDSPRLKRVSIPTSRQSLQEAATWWRHSIQSLKFDLICTFVIVVNACNLGAEVQYLAKGQDIPQAVTVVDIGTVAWYCLELLLRLWADKIVENVGWNFFDFLMLAASIINLAVDTEGVPGKYGFIRFLRFARLLRILKVVKIGKTVNDYFIVFAKMTFGLMHSIPSLLSAATVIVAFTYMSAVLLTQATTDYRTEHEAEGVSDALEEYYGTLEDTFMSLVKATFNGKNWEDLLDPLSAVGPFATVIFMMYLISTLLCFLNIIHGVFVDSALQSTAHYNELTVAEAERKRYMMLAHLQDVFHEMDTDASGFLTLEEFEGCLATPGGRAFFDSMGISTEQAQELFRLIDVDASSSVDIDEFVEGCLKFMGGANNFDLHRMLLENHQALEKWNNFLGNFESIRAMLASGPLHNRQSQSQDTMTKLSSMTSDVSPGPHEAPESFFKEGRGESKKSPMNMPTMLAPTLEGGGVGNTGSTMETAAEEQYPSRDATTLPSKPTPALEGRRRERQTL